LVARHDAILFDFDGVLADSEPLHFACWTEVSYSFGITFDWEWYRAHAVGIADREMMRLLAGMAKKDLAAEAMEHAFQEKKALFARRAATEVVIPESVRELILELALPAAVVSSSFRLEVEPALAAAGIRDRFRTLVFGDDVRKLKPHPEPYLLGASRLNAERPLVVEDSDTGAAAGQAAGFEVLRVASAYQTGVQVRAALV
jgi:HAD superfamily hydrolase (TIGR01509 family)